MDRLEDVDKYLDEWTRVQVEIWKEKIQRLKVVRSGALYQSFASIVSKTPDVSTLEMRFFRYGIYQAKGVGYGYDRNNGGDLKFLDKTYRHAHRLDEPRRVGPAWGGYKTSGKPRERRDWYSRPLFRSQRNLVEDLTRILSEDTLAMVCRFIESNPV